VRREKGEFGSQHRKRTVQPLGEKKEMILQAIDRRKARPMEEQKERISRSATRRKILLIGEKREIDSKETRKKGGGGGGASQGGKKFDGRGGERKTTIDTWERKKKGKFIDVQPEEKRGD